MKIFLLVVCAAQHKRLFQTMVQTDGGQNIPGKRFSLKTTAVYEASIINIPIYCASLFPVHLFVRIDLAQVL